MLARAGIPRYVMKSIHNQQGFFKTHGQFKFTSTEHQALSVRAQQSDTLLTLTMDFSTVKIAGHETMPYVDHF